MATRAWSWRRRSRAARTSAVTTVSVCRGSSRARTIVRRTGRRSAMATGRIGGVGNTTRTRASSGRGRCRARRSSGAAAGCARRCARTSATPRTGGAGAMGWRRAGTSTPMSAWSGGRRRRVGTLSAATTRCASRTRRRATTGACPTRWIATTAGCGCAATTTRMCASSGARRCRAAMACAARAGRAWWIARTRAGTRSGRVSRVGWPSAPATPMGAWRLASRWRARMARAAAGASAAWCA